MSDIDFPTYARLRISKRRRPYRWNFQDTTAGKSRRLLQPKIIHYFIWQSSVNWCQKVYEAMLWTDSNVRAGKSMQFCKFWLIRFWIIWRPPVWPSTYPYTAEFIGQYEADVNDFLKTFILKNDYFMIKIQLKKYNNLRLIWQKWKYKQKRIYKRSLTIFLIHKFILILILLVIM